LIVPAGQTAILGVHAGGGLTQLKTPPTGVVANVRFTFDPEQIDFVKGGFVAGNGLMVIVSEDVGPLPGQFPLVPYTSMLPEVALAAKLTLTKASVGLIWTIVAPVPV
jgi:hypothetical protein